MNESLPHISVCICTYKRLRFLKRLLQDVGAQNTKGKFTFSIVVADNDQTESARPVVSEFITTSKIPVTYCVEPQQNIALTRNRAIANAKGDYIAFVDDDEFPIADWLLRLFQACNQFKAAGVLGSLSRSMRARRQPGSLKENFMSAKCMRPALSSIGGMAGRGISCSSDASLRTESRPSAPSFLREKIVIFSGE